MLERKTTREREGEAMNATFEKRRAEEEEEC